jgi:hypothetical protein
VRFGEHRISKLHQEINKKENTPDGLHPDDPLHTGLPLEDLRKSVTGALGHLPLLRTLAIPELTVTLTVRSHGVSGKLLFPVD